MIICICARVSDKTIERCARAGQSFDDIQFEHGVAMQCGQCAGCARDIWDRCNGASTVAHIRQASETTAA
jgi:bacterioferritin-associated ferredoxin